MMERIKIVYIDDSPDNDLSRFLDKVNQHFDDQEYEFESEDIIFQTTQSYESLLQDTRIRTANIIVIDSRLFEDRAEALGRFTGEEFKIVLQKFYPYIEVIVVTQNEADPQIRIISKYDKSGSETGTDYYTRAMLPHIKEAIQDIMIYRKLANKMNENSSWEAVLKEKVLGTLQGTQAYDTLTKEDIDSLIDAFREIGKMVNGG